MLGSRRNAERQSIETKPPVWSDSRADSLARGICQNPELAVVIRSFTTTAPVKMPCHYRFY